MSKRGAHKPLVQPPFPSPPSAQELGRRTVRYSRPGSAWAIHLNPAQYGCHRLAAELADIWVHLADIGAGSPDAQLAAIRSLLASVDAQARGADLGLADLSLEHLEAWEAGLLAAQRRSPSATPYTKAIHLLALLRWLSDQPGAPLRPEVKDRAGRGTRLEPFRRAGPDEYDPRERHLLVRTAIDVVKEETSRLRAARDAGETFSASADGLIACHVLASAATGEPPEAIRMLKVADLTLDPLDPSLNGLGPEALAIGGHRVGEVRVTFTKNRAHSTYERSYRGWLARWAFPATLRLTAPLRSSHGLPHLFVGLGRDGEARRFEPNRGGGLAGWVERQGLAGELFGPHTFWRLRKAAVAGAVDNDPVGYRRDRANHSTEILFAHYLTSERTRNRQGAKLALRMKALFGAAMAGEGSPGPTVVDDGALRLLATGLPVPGIAPGTARALAANKLDGPMAACRDPLSSPHAPAGQVCPFSANGACYRCPNAFITKRHVPAILGLLDVIDPARAGDLAVWSKAWEDVYLFLTTAVLPALGVDGVDHAHPGRTCPIDPGVRNQPRGAHVQC
ncbi:MAG: hypothetical protein ACRD0J_00405 [Acidimicrobiales bacterium]